MCNTTQAIWTLTPTILHNHLLLCKPRLGVLRLGESHRRDHRLLCNCTCAYAKNGACTRTCTGGTASNCHGHQPLRHATRCYARYYIKPSSFACSYRLSGKSEQTRRCTSSRPEGHDSTGAQTRISSEFGHRAPTRRRVQHRVRLRHDQHARKLFGGEIKEKVRNTFKEVAGLPQAERWEAASDRDTTSLEKHGVYRAGTNHRSPGRTEGDRYAVGKLNQGR